MTERTEREARTESSGPIATSAGEPELLIRPDPDAVSRLAAERIAAALVEAVAKHDRANFCTTGGSTPIGIYRWLAAPPLGDAVPWNQVHVWWGDDRFVPRDNPASNVRSFEDVLLRASAVAGLSGQGDYGHDARAGVLHGVPILAENVHPWPTSEAIAAGRNNAWCATHYAATVRAAVPISAAGWPVFDAVLVGIGDDGHVLSVFPESPALDSDALTLAIPAPTHIEPHLPRVTFNPRILDATPVLLAVTSGASKADAIGRIFGSQRDERRWPAQRARRPGATWIIDRAAAAQMPPRGTSPVG